MVRMKSPSPGSSTLITSAPSSPSSPAQKGAEIRVPTSTTRMPASGPVGSLMLRGSGWPWSRSAMTSRMEPLALRAASALSAVAELCTQWCAMKWYLRASRLPMRVPVWLMVSLTVWAVTGGTRATRSASSLVRASSSARGTTRLTRPSRHASWASMVSPVSRNSFALRIPSSHGSTRSSTPAPVRRRTGLEKTASSAATIRSHMAASMRPAATQLPCTAAIVGLRKSWMRRQRS